MNIPASLFKLFPNSKKNPFIITSQASTYYNCIAWACEITDRCMWPDVRGRYTWPKGIPQDITIYAFIKLFESYGYSACDNGRLEESYQKIAIYADNQDVPTHAARQLPNGNWTSKLGDQIDVEHSLEAMENGFYGNIKLFMRKKN